MMGFIKRVWLEGAIKLLEDYISLHKRRVGLSIEILKIIGISWLVFSGSSMELGLGKLKKQKDGLSDNRMTIPIQIYGWETILYSHDDHEEYQAITHAMITRSWFFNQT